MKTARRPALKQVRRESTRESKSPARSQHTLTFRGLAMERLDLEVEQVSVASARTGMPGLIRESAQSGRAFLVKNAKNPAAASALLINPDVLRRRLERAQIARTLSDLLDSLPFGRLRKPRLRVEISDDRASELRVRTTKAGAEKARDRSR